MKCGGILFNGILNRKNDFLYDKYAILISNVTTVEIVILKVWLFHNKTFVAIYSMLFIIQLTGTFGSVNQVKIRENEAYDMCSKHQCC